ncbi:hypothetical protein [Maritimibacter alexandrii]|uniref:hypothetical protein n=1 Tax=Maritimibacter alexandrii TaxID=2570355 RepID=UPI00110991C8|nr:hypothetical protein [Maritimibacter alexandrii]
MAKVVQFRTYRRKPGGKLQVPRQSHYTIAIRFPPLTRGRQETETRVYAVTRAFIDEMGGFSLASGFTKAKMRCGVWHTLAFPVKSKRVHAFIQAIDAECANGLIEVRVEDQVMSAA